MGKVMKETLTKFVFLMLMIGGTFFLSVTVCAETQGKININSRVSNLHSFEGCNVEISDLMPLLTA